MKDAMGLIITEADDFHITELTDYRTVPALPIGGRYRLIDFILSNMVNSGITNVGITTRHNYSSLMEHIGAGNEWDLNRKEDGLTMLPPNANCDAGVPVGNLDILHGVLSFVRHSRQKYIVLSEGHMVFNMNFQDALDFHEVNAADITVLYHEEEKRPQQGIVLEMDEDGRITAAQKSNRMAKSKKADMNIYIMEKSFLENMVEECISRGQHDFAMDVLIANVKRLRMYGYRFEGYLGRVVSLKDYYENNMHLLDETVRGELFGGKNRIYTKIMDQVPTRYGACAAVHQSLIADGCTIEGEVENSIISRAVTVGKNVKIKNSIILQNTIIQDGCELENVVIDKECVIRQGKRLIGQKNYPVVVGMKTVV